VQKIKETEKGLFFKFVVRSSFEIYYGIFGKNCEKIINSKLDKIRGEE
jgi:hypothetical protein